MTDETVTIEVELPNETHEFLAEAGDPAAVLAGLADDEARMLDSVGRYVERDDESDGRASRSGSLFERSPPIGVLLGFETMGIDPGRSKLRMEAGPRHANPMGTLHGGVLCDLGDAAMGYAFASTLEEEESFTTLELNVNYLKPVWNGELIATGEVVKSGRTVGLVECDVRDAEGSLVARLKSTCLKLRGDAASGR
jgi:uncharacterized protein (TIGR00369 family)